jgi:hypothetical protein
MSRDQQEPAGEDLQRWVAAQVAELGVDPSAVDVDRVLDLARDVAHGVGRPAVPLTGFLAGYAVGAGSGDRAALEQVLDRLGAAARSWRAEQGTGTP